MTEHLPPGTPENPAGSAYPPAAYAAAVPTDLTSAPPASLLRWVLLTAAGGILVGAAWWLLAPGGAFFGNGTDYTIWPVRDFTLGGLGTLAGLATAVTLLPRAQQRGSMAKLFAALAGGLLGSVIAWQLGLFAGHVFHPQPANVPSLSIAFSLRAPSILLIWPFVTALVIFAYTLVGQLFAPASRGR